MGISVIVLTERYSDTSVSIMNTKYFLHFSWAYNTVHLTPQAVLRIRIRIRIRIREDQSFFSQIRIRNVCSWFGFGSGFRFGSGFGFGSGSRSSNLISTVLVSNLINKKLVCSFLVFYSLFIKIDFVCQSNECTM